MTLNLFIKELGRRFNKNDIGLIAENKENYISFNVKINAMLAGVKYKDGKNKVRKKERSKK